MFNIKTVYDAVIALASDVSDGLTSLGNVDTDTGNISNDTSSIAGSASAIESNTNHSVLEFNGPATVIVTTSGTAVPLSAVSFPVIGFEVTALSTNTQKVYVGGSGVHHGTAPTNPLDASETFTRDPVFGYSFDLSDFYVDSNVNLEGVLVTYYALPTA